MIKDAFFHVFFSLKGWSTRKKLILIESDDWGSIRMPSKKTYEKLLKAGYPVDKNMYERYDSLESEEDLDQLFNLLLTFKDKNGKHPIFTANSVVANPDFDKIRSAKFEKYYFELIPETFKKYPKHAKSMDLWHKGISAGIFFPQFHCREHLNVSHFMNNLKNGDKDLLFGFEQNMAGIITKDFMNPENNYVEPLNYNSIEDKNEKLSIYTEGLDLFEHLIGYKSITICPPNYLWSYDFNHVVHEKGVRYIQGLRKIWEPQPGRKHIAHNRYLGKISRNNIVCLVRNVFFEPAFHLNNYKDTVDHCLSRIQIAFNLHKPAIIGTHRLNYIGSIEPKNRGNTLKQLTILLTRILKEWPEVEFITSNQLGAMIYNDPGS